MKQSFLPRTISARVTVGVCTAMLFTSVATLMQNTSSLSAQLAQDSVAVCQQQVVAQFSELQPKIYSWLMDSVDQAKVQTRADIMQNKNQLIQRLRTGESQAAVLAPYIATLKQEVQILVAEYKVKMNTGQAELKQAWYDCKNNPTLDFNLDDFITIDVNDYNNRKLDTNDATVKPSNPVPTPEKKPTPVPEKPPTICDNSHGTLTDCDDTPEVKVKPVQKPDPTPVIHTPPKPIKDPVTNVDNASYVTSAKRFGQFIVLKFNQAKKTSLPNRVYFTFTFNDGSTHEKSAMITTDTHLLQATPVMGRERTANTTGLVMSFGDYKEVLPLTHEQFEPSYVDTVENDQDFIRVIMNEDVFNGPNANGKMLEMYRTERRAQITKQCAMGQTSDWRQKCYAERYAELDKIIESLDESDLAALHVTYHTNQKPFSEYRFVLRNDPNLFNFGVFNSKKQTTTQAGYQNIHAVEITRYNDGTTVFFGSDRFTLSEDTIREYRYKAYHVPGMQNFYCGLLEAKGQSCK